MTMLYPIVLETEDIRAVSALPVAFLRLRVTSILLAGDSLVANRRPA
jgi:hypothetical protein